MGWHRQEKKVTETTQSEPARNPLEEQPGGNHYKKYKIQPVEFITENNLGFLEGNVIKYVCRFRDKNGLEDLAKAKHYIELLELFYAQDQDDD